MKHYTPKIYQEKALKWMLEHPKCGLFLDMGLGKTVVTLTGITLLKGLLVDRVLIIAPKRVAKFVWKQEAKIWKHTKHLTFSIILGTEKERKDALKADADIYVINRENVVWLCEQYKDGILPFDMVVIDESSSFKNHSSKRFKALKKAIVNIPRIVLLTGTPAPRGYLNLWSQLYLLDGGKRLGKTITEYRNRYFTPGFTHNGIVYNYTLRKGADEAIKNLISDICISFKAEDWLDLPPLYPVIDEVELSEGSRRIYDDFEKEQVMRIMNTDVVALNAVALSGKLLQISDGAIYVNDEHDWEEIHQEKIDKLIDIIEDAGGKSVLIAYDFLHGKERLLKALAPYKPRELKTDKDKEDWDAGRIQVLLGHPASMGHGLNMQSGGSIAVWFGLTWDLELYQQFNARLHRQGQTMPVYIHHILCKDTEDERVYKALQRKSNTQEALLQSLKEKIDKYKTL